MRARVCVCRQGKVCESKGVYVQVGEGVCEQGRVCESKGVYVWAGEGMCRQAVEVRVL